MQDNVKGFWRKTESRYAQRIIEIMKDDALRAAFRRAYPTLQDVGQRSGGGVQDYGACIRLKQERYVVGIVAALRSQFAKQKQENLSVF